jgi:hypothetical protein
LIAWAACIGPEADHHDLILVAEYIPEVGISQ